MNFDFVLQIVFVDQYLNSLACFSGWLNFKFKPKKTMFYFDVISYEKFEMFFIEDLSY